MPTRSFHLLALLFAAASAPWASFRDAHGAIGGVYAAALPSPASFPDSGSAYPALQRFTKRRTAPRVEIRDVDGPVRADGYIITFTDGANATEAHDAIVASFGEEAVSYRYDTETSTVRGLSGTFNATEIRELQGADFVQSIEPDVIGKLDALATQYDAPWGLQRVSQVNGLPDDSDEGGLGYTYTYDQSAGQGVDIYVLDSGINTAHTDFGGRARWGKTFGGFPDEDTIGHGTHVAGTAGGNRYGVAKRANLIAVRFVDASGNGLASDFVAAVQWIIAQAASSGRPSVVNISVHFPGTDSIDQVVTDAINAGLHVVVSAGNRGTDASSQSPARVPVVTTVAATTIRDEAAYYSNYGPLVDIWAPGSSIISAWIGSNTATATLTGTSMAAPHVAGITALLISRVGNRVPAALLALLQSLSPFRSLSDVPDGTINQLANNGAFTLTGVDSKEDSTTLETNTESSTSSSTQTAISSSTNSEETSTLSPPAATNTFTSVTTSLLWDTVSSTEDSPTSSSTTTSRLAATTTTTTIGRKPAGRKPIFPHPPWRWWW